LEFSERVGKTNSMKRKKKSENDWGEKMGRKHSTK